MAEPTIVWRHSTVAVYEDGFARVDVGGDPGTHAISGGGFANGLDGTNATSTDTWGNDIGASSPVVGSFAVYDSGPDRTMWAVVFAAAPGADLRVHVFAILRDEP